MLPQLLCLSLTCFERTNNVLPHYNPPSRLDMPRSTLSCNLVRPRESTKQTPCLYRPYLQLAAACKQHSNDYCSVPAGKHDGHSIQHWTCSAPNAGKQDKTNTTSSVRQHQVMCLPGTRHDGQACTGTETTHVQAGLQDAAAEAQHPWGWLDPNYARHCTVCLVNELKQGGTPDNQHQLPPHHHNPQKQPPN